MRTSLLLLLILTIVTISFAEPSQFGNAYRLLNKKNAIGAINTLKQRVASNEATPGEWELFSIATWNAYGEDSLGSALRTATAAYRYAPTKDHKALVDWFQQKISNRIEGIPEMILIKVIRNAFLSIPALVLSGLMALGVLITFGWWLFRSFLHLNLQSKLNKIIPSVGIGMFVIILGLSIWRYEWITNPMAYVTQTGVSVFQKPDFSSKEIGSISTGTEVKPLSTFGKWQEVRLADGRTGWIQSNVLEYLVLD